MKFAEVIGQDELKSVLRKSVDQGRVSHAQLFSGQSGAGSLALALAYVQYLNCTDRRGADSCGECPSCIKMNGLVHPDLHFVFPSNVPKQGDSNESKSGGSEKKHMCDDFLPKWREMVASTGGYFDDRMWYDFIGMGNQQGIIADRESDELMRKLSFKSFESQYKSVIIWLPETMRDPAPNKLLKILEEPWERTLFILVSAEPHELMSTILSRVQEFAVPAIEPDALKEYAENQLGANGPDALSATRLSGGDLIELRTLLESDHGENVRENFEYFANLMRYSYGDKHLELFSWAEEMASLGRESQKRFLEYSVAMLRESYVLAAGLENISYLWGGEREFCRKFAPFVGNHNIEELVGEHQSALLHIMRNGNAKIIFTHFALSISKLIVKI